MATKVTKWKRFDGRIIPTTCYYWLNGKCNRNPCRFLHSQPSSPSAAYVNCNGRKRCSDSENSLPKRKLKVAVWNRKTEVVEAAQNSSPTLSTEVVEAAQSSSPTLSTEVVEAAQSLSPTLSIEVVEASQSSSPTLSKEVVEAAQGSSPTLSTEVVEAAQGSSPTLSTEVVEAAQSSLPTLCKYWIKGNCAHGDKCLDIHSWSGLKVKRKLSMWHIRTMWKTFSERGRLFARQEVRSIEKGPGGLIFTGDGTGLVTVSKWSEESNKVEAA
ncbi:hypothetical protein TSUD_348830 [Trifolium subterraneum]|uniref:C3H1-type domain-containing protein n=1 Tax=Trifolium subterraneum TaxID=3900 RepID=A0A2Z6NB39_TRISU|nr:hypothetical protein TSUD_348830 [Trifolium subterraneum]